MGLPCGTFNETYAKDMAVVRTRLQWALLIGFIILLFLSPRFLDDYLLSIINSIGIWLIAVLGLNLLTGYCGQINLGQAAFMAVGAYTSAILITRFGWSFWSSLPFAMLAAGIVGMFFGLPALRIKGFYLAMTTLAAQFIIIWAMMHGGSVTGGGDGLRLPRVYLGNIAITSETGYFYIIMPLGLLMLFFAKNIARTRVGRAFVAVRDNDLAAEVMGVNIYGYKLVAFFLSSVYAGMAGCLLANYMRMAHYEHYALMDSIWMLGMLIVGGLGSTMGAVFGTMFIKLLMEGVAYLSPLVSEVLPAIAAEFFASMGLIAIAVMIMLFLIFEPRGINHRWEILKRTYRIFPFSY